MSKTIRNYKDKEFLNRDKYFKRTPRKHKKARKFFGFTSGNNGKCNKTDKSVKVKGKDYIKYGWPLELRSKQAVINKIDADIEMELLNETL